MRHTLVIDKVKDLILQGMSDADIAKTLGYSPNGVGYIRKVKLKLPILSERVEITKEIEEGLLGTVLGDSGIYYIHDECRYPHLQFSHCRKQQDYFEEKVKLFKPLHISTRSLSGGTYTIRGKSGIRQSGFIASSMNLKCLVKYRDLFYPENKKIIPVDYFKDNFTAKSLAYYFMDDGCINGKTYSLGTYSFDYKNIEEFCDFLLSKFNVKCNIKKDKSLYVTYGTAPKFTELVYPYITPSMQYKLVTEYCPH